MSIKGFNEFITEELKRVLSDSSRTLIEPLDEIADILRNKTKISASELIYILYSMD